MYSLVYVSRLKIDFDVPDLVNKAAEKNRHLGISGYLCKNGQYFLQFLEGDTRSVTGLMQQIYQDRRHEVINTIETTFDERIFPSWRMRFLTNDKFVEIKLEHILQDVLLQMKNDIYDQEEVKENAERLISKIASLLYRQTV